MHHVYKGIIVQNTKRNGHYGKIGTTFLWWLKEIWTVLLQKDAVICQSVSRERVSSTRYAYHSRTPKVWMPLHPETSRSFPGKGPDSILSGNISYSYYCYREWFMCVHQCWHCSSPLRSVWLRTRHNAMKITVYAGQRLALAITTMTLCHFLW